MLCSSLLSAVSPLRHGGLDEPKSEQLCPSDGRYSLYAEHYAVIEKMVFIPLTNKISYINIYQTVIIPKNHLLLE